jgi:hypothetical protein
MSTKYFCDFCGQEVKPIGSEIEIEIYQIVIYDPPGKETKKREFGSCCEQWVKRLLDLDRVQIERAWSARGNPRDTGVRLTAADLSD